MLHKLLKKSGYNRARKQNASFRTQGIYRDICLDMKRIRKCIDIETTIEFWRQNHLRVLVNLRVSGDARPCKLDGVVGVGLELTFRAKAHQP